MQAKLYISSHAIPPHTLPSVRVQLMPKEHKMTDNEQRFTVYQFYSLKTGETTYGVWDNYTDSPYDNTGRTKLDAQAIAHKANRATDNEQPVDEYKPLSSSFDIGGINNLILVNDGHKTAEREQQMFEDATVRTMMSALRRNPALRRELKALLVESDGDQ